jgi:hypothetical protein
MQIGIDSLGAVVPDSLTRQGKIYEPSPTLSGICIGPSTVVESSVQLSHGTASCLKGRLPVRRCSSETMRIAISW